MRVFAADLQFPEGPVWVGDGSLLVVEIRRRTLTRCLPDGRKTLLRAGRRAQRRGDRSGRLLLCRQQRRLLVQAAWRRPWVTSGTADDYVTGRIDRVNLETGKFETLYDKVDGHNLRGPNDLVMDAHGGFWFTDPGKTRHRDWDRGSVCYAKCDGSLVREMVFPIHKPNGIGLSPDGRTLYVAETETARLWAWDLKGPGEFAKPATASPASPHGSRLVYGSPMYQRFDSLAVEAGGNVCVATLDRGGINVIDPKTGTAEFVEVPGRHALHEHLFRRKTICARRTSRSRMPGTSSRWTGRGPDCRSTINCSPQRHA